MKILIYQDYKHNHHVLFRAMEGSFGKGNVDFVDAEEIINEQRLSAANLMAMVMPGGADLYYAEKLNGAGNRIIREYVMNGGVYVGICAGSYYGCKRLSWAEKEEDTNQHISGSRQLAFFKGTAVGPVYDFLEKNDFKRQHSNAVAVEAKKALGNAIPLLKYSGGPVFIPDNIDDQQVEVLGRYHGLKHQPIAILKVSSGKGMALLISPHIEDSGIYNERKTYKLHNGNYRRAKKITKQLMEHEQNRTKLWNYLMDLIKQHDHDTRITD